MIKSSERQLKHVVDKLVLYNGKDCFSNVRHLSPRLSRCKKRRLSKLIHGNLSLVGISFTIGDSFDYQESGFEHFDHVRQQKAGENFVEVHYLDFVDFGVQHLPEKSLEMTADFGNIADVHHERSDNFEDWNSVR